MTAKISSSFFFFFFLFLNFIDANYTLKFRIICDDILLLIKFLNIDDHYFDKGFKQIVNVLLCAVLCNCKKLGESEGGGEVQKFGQEMCQS